MAGRTGRSPPPEQHQSVDIHAGSRVGSEGDGRAAARGKPPAAGKSSPRVVRSMRGSAQLASARVRTRGMRAAFQWATAQPRMSAGSAPSSSAGGCWPGHAAREAAAGWPLGLERWRAIALAELVSVRLDDQRQVQVAWLWQAEDFLQIKLARRRIEQVGAAHHIGDALPGVIQHHGQLIGNQAVAAANDEIADLAARCWRNSPCTRSMKTYSRSGTRRRMAASSRLRPAARQKPG